MLMDASSTESIVARLARSELSDDIKEELRTMLSNGCDWSSLLRLAADWELEPIVLSNLLAHFSEAIPENEHSLIVSRARETRAWAIAKSLAAVELSNLLNQNKVQAIVLKGPTVSILAYEDLSLRTFSDIDLLVRRCDVSAARDILLHNGYKRDYEANTEGRLLRDGHALEFSSEGNKVELHSDLLPRYLHLDLDVADVFNDSIFVKVGSGQVRSLSRHHLVIYMCAHGAKHAWSSMRWIADLGNSLVHLVPDDVDNVLALAKRTHSRRLLAVGIRKVRCQMGMPAEMFSKRVLVPESDTIGLLDTRETSARWGAMQKRIVRFHPYLPILAYWFRCRERTWDNVVSITILASHRLTRR